MNVQSRSNNLGHTPRPSAVDRQTGETETVQQKSFARRDDAITGSQTILSTSLADALWSIQRVAGDEDRAPLSTVESIYRAYAA